MVIVVLLYCFNVEGTERSLFHWVELFVFRKVCAKKISIFIDRVRLWMMVKVVMVGGCGGGWIGKDGLEVVWKDLVVP